MAGRALRLPGRKLAGLPGVALALFSGGDRNMCPTVAQACRPSFVQHAFIKHLLLTNAGRNKDVTAE